MKIGICIMKNKLNRPHVQKLFSRFRSSGNVVFFDETTILTKKIIEWEPVDILITFFHKSLPFNKVFEYASLHNIMCINDLVMQYVLLDRRVVYKIMERNRIKTPEYILINRNPTKRVKAMDEYLQSVSIDVDTLSRIIIEGSDYIEVDGIRLYKPFVEKPADAENHNIYVYYKNGDVRKLFRKRGNKSSELYHTIRGIRNDGNYIYEKFYEAEGSLDIKVYAMGSDAVYAETRKSPVVDGIVERDLIGYELRNTIELNNEEVATSKAITQIFKQFICGFDILRCSEGSFVIDVNGWSFVKTNMHYYDICFDQLNLEFKRLANKFPLTRKIIRIYRHGDRTPKQKLKVKIKDAINFEDSERVFRHDFEEILEALDGNTNIKVQELRNVLSHVKNERGTKVQIKCTQESTEIILKWGGTLTHTGIEQSKVMGKTFKNIVISRGEKLTQNLRIFSSSEDRVTACAKHFVEAFIDERKELIIDKVLLDNTFHANGEIEVGREDIKAAFENFKNSKDDIFIIKSIENLPVSAITNNYDQYSNISDRWYRIKSKISTNPVLTHTLIMEISDNLKFDLLHNNSKMVKLFGEGNLQKLFFVVGKYVNFIIENEYGKSNVDKLRISKAITGTLLNKLINDIEHGEGITIYFTKESRMYTLFNLLSHFCKVQFKEFDYCSMIEILLLQTVDGKVIRVSINRGVDANYLLKGPTPLNHSIPFNDDEIIYEVSVNEFLKMISI